MIALTSFYPRRRLNQLVIPTRPTWQSRRSAQNCWARYPMQQLVRWRSERWLLGSVARIARRATADIAITASPIECGLDSLQAFQLLGEIESVCDVRLSPALLLGERDLASIAAQIVAAREPDARSPSRPSIERRPMVANVHRPRRRKDFGSSSNCTAGVTRTTSCRRSA